MNSRNPQYIVFLKIFPQSLDISTKKVYNMFKVLEKRNKKKVQHRI